MLGELDHRVGQQLQGPARTPLGRTGAGGRHQKRFLLARQLAVRAAARLFAERGLQIAFDEAPLGPYTVDPPTATPIAISSSLAPTSAASSICARLSLRAACLPPLSKAVR